MKISFIFPSDWTEKGTLPCINLKKKNVAYLYLTERTLYKMGFTVDEK